MRGGCKWDAIRGCKVAAKWLPTARNTSMSASLHLCCSHASLVASCPHPCISVCILASQATSLHPNLHPCIPAHILASQPASLHPSPHLSPLSCSRSMHAGWIFALKLHPTVASRCLYPLGASCCVNLQRYPCICLHWPGDHDPPFHSQRYILLCISSRQVICRFLGAVEHPVHPVHNSTCSCQVDPSRKTLNTSAAACTIHMTWSPAAHLGLLQIQCIMLVAAVRYTVVQRYSMYDKVHIASRTENHHRTYPNLQSQLKHHQNST